MSHEKNLPENLDIEAVRSTLLEAARAAGEITLPVFRSGAVVDNKEDQGFDPVTRADRDAELAIREIVEREFPEHGIVGEEYPDKTSDSPFSWIIDPIDGTRAFISGVPVWGTLIGLTHKGRAIGGLMSQPFTGEIYLGLAGASTRLWDNEKSRLSVSGVQKLADAILFTTTPALFSRPQRAAFDGLENKVRLSRYGCDCYAYCLLAAGHIDLVVEPGLNIYDIAALIPIIEYAGGRVTTFEGGVPDGGGDIIAAATPELHRQALDIMGSK
ncbi:MAG TPA: histidinol-phosphatase [Devosia sp.]|nr:histidinol-phosphatase [Devosia sp.]